jgi:hypothetical protein
LFERHPVFFVRTQITMKAGGEHEA